MKEPNDDEQARQVTKKHVRGRFGSLEDRESFVGALTGARIPRGQGKEAVR
jgi:hypothetical protein